MRLQLISCQNDGTSAENTEGTMLSRGHMELYSFVQFTMIKEKNCGIYNPVQVTPDIWHTHCYCITLKAITSTRLKSLGMLADDIVSRSVAKSYTGFERVKGV
jgi:hypothetical protein